MTSPVVFCRECGSSRVLSTTSKACCSAAQSALQHVPNLENRILKPRIQGKEVSWNEAFEFIQAQTVAAQKKNLNAIGLYAGKKTFYRGLDWVESLLFSVRIGSSSFFTDLAIDDANRLLVTEWMLGHATPLLSDLSRAHNILFIGDNPKEVGWGMLQPDHDYLAEIQHSQNTKHTKVSFVSSQSFESGLNAQEQCILRPGTEPFFLLGMLSLVLNNAWYDAQYVQKYTEGLEEIRQWMQPYTLKRCADICGVTEAQISGITLKWVRSAMSILHLTPGALRCEHATLGAWAWLVLHTLSANTLRPGGLYEAMGALDLLPVLVALRTENAPKSQVGGQPLLLGQNMGSQLLLEMERGHLHTLFLLESPTTVQPARFEEAFSKLPCSIVFAETESALTQKATVVLPRSTSWEETDILVHRNPQFAFSCLPISAALHPPVGEAKSVHEVLNTLGQTIKFAWTGSDWGLSNRLIAKQVQKGGQQTWLSRIWGMLNEDDLNFQGSVHFKGEHDRALWRPSQDQIQLAPVHIAEVFRKLGTPQNNASYPYSLHSSHHRTHTDEQGIIASVHPKAAADLQLKEGQRATLKTMQGSLEVTVVLSENQHPSAVLCSADALPVRNLLPTQTDLWTGTPIWNGVACTLA